jgi:hypothetical protein
MRHCIDSRPAACCAVKHPRLPFQWGAGTLSVMGISFTTVPIAQIAVPLLMAAYPPKEAGECDFNYGYFTSASHGPKGFQPGSKAGGSPCTSQLAGVQPFGPFGPSCVPNCQSEAFDYAWGKLLGTLCFCALIPMFISGAAVMPLADPLPPAH